MTYTIIGPKHRIDILGNFMFINDNPTKFPTMPKFNIVTEPELINEVIETRDDLVVSIASDNDFSKAKTIVDIFDYFDLAHCFATEEEIEEYY